MSQEGADLSWILAGEASTDASWYTQRPVNPDSGRMTAARRLKLDGTPRIGASSAFASLTRGSTPLREESARDMGIPSIVPEGKPWRATGKRKSPLGRNRAQAESRIASEMEDQTARMES